MEWFGFVTHTCTAVFRNQFTHQLFRSQLRFLLTHDIILDFFADPFVVRTLLRRNFDDQLRFAQPLIVPHTFTCGTMSLGNATALPSDMRRVTLL